MRALVQKLQGLVNKNPALLLILFVYLYILPKSLSYDNAWMQPEEFNIKRAVLLNGPGFNSFDIQNGLNWRQFENFQPRCTRPLSSYFEIVDTKFRVWAWHFIMPHPSLSLTWIFSLILAPIFLFKLLRNTNISTYVATLLVAFYVATPEVLSSGAMLFRPAKPMTNFFIILCLYVASRLKKSFVDKELEIPMPSFLCLLALSVFTVFWDETALLILPALLIFFPQIVKSRTRLWLFLTMPLLVLLGYFVIIPNLTLLAGYEYPHLLAYHKFDELKSFEIMYCSLQLLAINAKNLVLETIGIIQPVSANASVLVKAMIIAAEILWGVIFYYILKSKIKTDSALFFLFGLILFFNYLMTITNGIWGPYYYGDFWSVFFVYWLAKCIDKVSIPKYWLTGFFFIILTSMYLCFIATNTVYKEYHFYPCKPLEISSFFQGDRLRFSSQEKLPFSGGDIKSITNFYWSHLKEGKHINYNYLPRELYWLAIELEPNRLHPRYILPGDNGAR